MLTALRNFYWRIELRVDDWLCKKVDHFETVLYGRWSYLDRQVGPHRHLYFRVTETVSTEYAEFNCACGKARLLLSPYGSLLEGEAPPKHLMEWLVECTRNATTQAASSGKKVACG